MPKMPTAHEQQMTEIIDALSKIRSDNYASLHYWTEWTDEAKVPSDLTPALMTGRIELFKLAKPRPLTKEECAALYHLVAVLVETNASLRAHAEQTAELVSQWLGHFKGMTKTAMKIEDFANFRDPTAHDDDDEE